VAHQFVVDSRHFKKTFLSRTAKRLADRLSKVLSPLIKGKCSVGENTFEEELEAIFQSALEIKTFGMTANHVFEFIWPFHNAGFESDSMVEEILGTCIDERNFPEKKAKKVMLTLVPGLRVYSCQRKFVDYCNFTSGDEKGLGKADLVAHALVMTQ
jgi:hypothetical protein